VLLVALMTTLTATTTPSLTLVLQATRLKTTGVGVINVTLSASEVKALEIAQLVEVMISSPATTTTLARKLTKALKRNGTGVASVSACSMDPMSVLLVALLLVDNMMVLRAITT